MNETSGRSGPSWGLVLLIPAALIIAKGAMRRRAMWESSWGPSGMAGGRHGHHGHFANGEGEADPRAGFRLPPKIESMLDAWHTRAHEATEPTEPPTA
jgi:hypothetical protein